MSKPFTWDENHKYQRGKVLSAEELEVVKDWGRYKDVDGDGVPYRTIPGVHPSKGAYFTRGSSHNEYAKYTEDADTYIRIMERLAKKYETAKNLVPAPEISGSGAEVGIIYYGTSAHAAEEACDLMSEAGHAVDAMCIKAFPFSDQVKKFIDDHKVVFVIEQNRDAQLRTLLMTELDANPVKMVKVLHYDGTPIGADFIQRSMLDHFQLQTL